MALLINSAQLERFSGRPALVQRLIQIYMDISPSMIADIQSAASGGDIELLGSQAHSLKGSSAELGAEKLADLSHQLQMTAKSGNTALIDPLVNDLAHCYEDTIAALKVLDPC